jgi:hypothetical protein
MWRRAWVRAGIGVAGGVAAASFAGWYFVLRDVAEPTTVGEAVTSFRESRGRSGKSAVPEGVYVYTTAGFERTNALTGVTHRYPPRSTITVTRDPCGFHMRWDVLRGRSTVWSICVLRTGWTVASQDERHTFFGRTERTTYLCQAGGRPFWPKLPTTARRYLCSTPNATEHGLAGVAGRGDLTVGGSRLSTVHLVTTSSYTGAIRGTSRYDFWLDRRHGVPVRVALVSRTTNDSPVGGVQYDENVTLRLVSLTPRR